MHEPVIGTSRRLTVGAPESRDCVPRLQHYRVNMRAGLEPSVGQHPLLASLRARYPRIGGLSAERQRYAAEDERRSASIESLCVRPLALR